MSKTDYFGIAMKSLIKLLKNHDKFLRETCKAKNAYYSELMKTLTEVFEDYEDGILHIFSSDDNRSYIFNGIQNQDVQYIINEIVFPSQTSLNFLEE